MRLIALIAQMFDKNRRFRYGKIALRGEGIKIRQMAFVYAPFEPDLPIVHEQSRLVVARISELRPKTDISSCACPTIEKAADRKVGGRFHALVGIDIKNPICVDFVQRSIARGCEVAIPGTNKKPRAERGGDRLRSVRGTCVYDDNVVNDVPQAFQTTREQFLFVARDDRRTDLRPS